MRARFQKKVLTVGGVYLNFEEKYGWPPLVIKSLEETVGIKMPTKAYYEDGKLIENKDELVRIVLTNGMIRYMKKGTYIIK